MKSQCSGRTAHQAAKMYASTHWDNWLSLDGVHTNLIGISSGLWTGIHLFSSHHTKSGLEYMMVFIDCWVKMFVHNCYFLSNNTSNWYFVSIKTNYTWKIVNNIELSTNMISITFQNLWLTNFIMKSKIEGIFFLIWSLNLSLTHAISCTRLVKNWIKY